MRPTTSVSSNMCPILTKTWQRLLRTVEASGRRIGVMGAVTSALAPDEPGAQRAVLRAVLDAPALAGKVHTATGADSAFAPTGWPLGRLSPLVPSGLRRGQVITVGGSAELVLELVAAASTSGAWCALVGSPELARAGLAAVAAGVVLERWVLVPDPGSRWSEAAATLIGAVDLVVIAPTGPVPAVQAGRLAARARQHGTVIVAVTANWPNPDLRLEAAGGLWHGLGDGRGQLTGHDMRITAHSKSGRPHTVNLIDGEEPIAGGTERARLRLVTT